MITTENLAQATTQQVFDQCVKHLLAQNERAVDERGNCVYLTERNTRCGAGHLLTTDDLGYLAKHYKLGGSWRALIEECYIAPQAHSELITEVQDIHDNGTPETWPDRLTLLAVRLNLEYNP